MPSDVLYETILRKTSRTVWRELADLFVESFSSAPYFEDPRDLRQILTWGPEHLAHTSGVLVTARQSGALVGFALAHSLADDRPWQSILRQVATSQGTAAAALAAPEDALVLHELAVRQSHRGRGIARSCLLALVSGRAELQTFVGVYDRATEAAAMYRHWQAVEIGQVPMRGDATALHVLTTGTAALRKRLSARSD